MPEAVYKDIADDLRSRIVAGELEPGDDVPTEAELAERWQTSRGPIRNALALLRTEGLIETTRGRPARVVDRKAQQRVDVSIPFTRWAREIGAVPGARTQEISLRRVDEPRAALLGIAPGTTIVEVLRLRLLDGIPTMLERLAYTEAAGRVLLDIDLDAVSITEVLDAHGFATFDVVHEIEAAPADELDAHHLDLAEGTPVLRLHRVSRDAAGRTFEASKESYRSDIVRFTVSAAGDTRSGEHYVRALRS